MAIKGVSINYKLRENSFSIIIAALCLAPIVVSALMSTDGTTTAFSILGFSIHLKTACLFKLATGYNCPVCGMTRAFIYISHGDVVSAFQMNKAGIPLYCLCVYEVVYRLAYILAGRNKIIKALIKIEIAFVTFVCVAIAAVFLAQFFH